MRDGKQIGILAQDTNYDFNLQETKTLKEPARVKRGDVLITECTYNTENRSTITWGGLSTTDEMCLAYMWYYPRIEFTGCNSFQTFQTVAAALNVSATSKEDLFAILQNWNWTERSAADMEVKLRDADHYLFTMDRTGHRFTKVKIPEIPEEKVIPCSRLGAFGGSVRQESVPLTLAASLLMVAWYQAVP
ncbi:DBH-like monooxygenase protein 2 homolog [Scyliorhinus canicula]|uniref:DBH-like monooxygenase protein 2 homolog n=1 Tax=Scyliorhinus canicula TaxID=7830 RepID=UPI0018F76E56|nr:DBH-like monooxygenase protein 2 homolog [Scyliorhinus canicula]